MSTNQPPNEVPTGQNNGGSVAQPLSAAASASTTATAPPNNTNTNNHITTLQYYLKVFGNVRAKDLCYIYNSNLLKVDTVGLRQTLAAKKGGVKGKKKKKKAKQSNATQQSTSAAESEATEQQPSQSAASQLTQSTQSTIDQEQEPIQPTEDAGYESSGDEKEVYDEDEVPEKDQHSQLQLLAAEDLEENEDYVKECTIEEEAEEHMGKAEFLEQSDDE